MKKKYQGLDSPSVAFSEESVGDEVAGSEDDAYRTKVPTGTT